MPHRLQPPHTGHVWAGGRGGWAPSGGHSKTTRLSSDLGASEARLRCEEGAAAGPRQPWGLRPQQLAQPRALNGMTPTRPSSWSGRDPQASCQASVADNGLPPARSKNTALAASSCGSTWPPGPPLLPPQPSPAFCLYHKHEGQGRTRPQAQRLDAPRRWEGGSSYPRSPAFRTCAHALLAESRQGQTTPRGSHTQVASSEVTGLQGSESGPSLPGASAWAQPPCWGRPHQPLKQKHWLTTYCLSQSVFTAKSPSQVTLLFQDVVDYSHGYSYG